jgi:hypothetical protein
MCRRCLASLLALALILCCAPLHSKACAQPQSTGNTKAQEQSAAKPNAQAGKKQQPTPSKKQVEKVMHAVFNVGVGRGLTVFLRNGDTLHGTLADIREDDFQIAEVDRRQTFTVRYDEVKEIRRGFGGVNLFTGQRVNPSRARTIARYSVLAFVLALPIILAASSKN